MKKLVLLFLMGVSLIGVFDRDSLLKTENSLRVVVSGDSLAHYGSAVFLTALVLFAVGSALMFLYDFAREKKLSVVSLQGFFLTTGLIHLSLGNYVGGVFSIIATLTVPVLKQF